VIKLSLKEAEGRLGRLIEEAAAGQEVVITSTGGRAVRLVPVLEETRTGKKVGYALDRFMGTWSAEEEAEFLKAIEVFEQVDEKEIG
jgi:prevent-host-death family protein